MRLSLPATRHLSVTELPAADASRAHAADRRRVLIIGPGWLGGALANEMHAAGDDVYTMRRTAAASADTAHGPRAVPGDIASFAGGGGSLPHGLPDAIDEVVLCVSPSRTRGDTHESTYPAAARGAVALAARLRARALLYVSSTGVYGRTDGAIVTEASDIAVGDARQEALALAERIVIDGDPSTAFGRVVLRVAGLYGPQRDPAPRFAAMQSTPDDPSYWCNFAWRSDVTSAITHLLRLEQHRQSAHCYNCADGTPLLARDVARRVARALAPVAVPAVSTAAVAPSVAATGAAPARRSTSNQRVAVEKLLATGWSPTMPTVYDGLEALGYDMSHDVVAETHA